MPHNSQGLVEARGRLEHPLILIYLLGGATGCSLNLLTTFTLQSLGLPVLVAFFIGIVTNIGIQNLYYQLIFATRARCLGLDLGALLVRVVLFGCAGMGLLWFFQERLAIDSTSAVLAALFTLSALSSVAIRMQTFASLELAQVHYEQVDKDFYDTQTDRKAVGWFRGWYHDSRFIRLRQLIHENYRPGMKIVDFGCGNCVWNQGGLPVVGVDVNAAMLRHAKAQGRLVDYRVTQDLAEPGLNERFDMAVVSEVLEHVPDVQKVVDTLRKTLKEKGVLIVTVPWDFFLSLFSCSLM